MSAQNGSTIIALSPRVSVLLPLIFRDPFDYRVAEGMELRPGDYVRVPFGRKSVWGVVWGESAGEVAEAKLKTIEALAAHLPPMSEAMRRFIDWVSWYTLSPRGMVLKMALSAPDALEPPASQWLYRLGAQGAKLTPARLRIVSYLSDGTARSLKDIATHAKASPALVRDFAKAGGLLPVEGEAAITESYTTPTLPDLLRLSPAQQDAADLLRGKLGSGFSVTLIDGVTGSGKTEVYFDTMAAALEAGRQVAVLLPEIALSVQWLARFADRFGFAPDIWHSHQTPARRRESWRRAAEGTARVVVGARSALFLPYKTLGLIVVDEEHDPSYKQEDGVIYQARDMAVVRAQHESIPLVLVSATPSLETEFNVERGRYHRVHLGRRHGAAELPEVRLVDMRTETLQPGDWISAPLKSAIIGTLGDRHQAMIFMNRRGYAPLMLCRACGHRLLCPECTASLVLHRAPGRLLCHHCGHSVKVPDACPDCHKENSLIAYGPGVERVAEELRRLFPDARIGVMTSDAVRIMTAGEDDKTLSPAELITAMGKLEIDLLVGTQMIAKGHHFGRLALVGVIDADMGLASGDLRAGERTYQLLHQLSGRAGRERTRGTVLLQTYMPEHPVMQALKAGDRDRFMWLEARMREDAAMPPYGKLAAIIVESREEAQAAKYARDLVSFAYSRKAGSLLPAETPHTLPPLILGPAPAPLARLRGWHRYRILIKAERAFHLQPWLEDWLHARKTPSGIKVKIDVDPYSFL